MVTATKVFPVHRFPLSRRFGAPTSREGSLLNTNINQNCLRLSSSSWNKLKRQSWKRDNRSLSQGEQAKGILNKSVRPLIGASIRRGDANENTHMYCPLCIQIRQASLTKRTVPCRRNPFILEPIYISLTTCLHLEIPQRRSSKPVINVVGMSVRWRFHTTPIKEKLFGRVIASSALQTTLLLAHKTGTCCSSNAYIFYYQHGDKVLVLGFANSVSLLWTHTAQLPKPVVFASAKSLLFTRFGGTEPQRSHADAFGAW